MTQTEVGQQAAARRSPQFLSRRVSAAYEMLGFLESAQLSSDYNHMQSNGKRYLTTRFTMTLASESRASSKPTPQRMLGFCCRISGMETWCDCKQPIYDQIIVPLNITRVQAQKIVIRSLKIKYHQACNLAQTPRLLSPMFHLLCADTSGPSKRVLKECTSDGLSGFLPTHR